MKQQGKRNINLNVDTLYYSGVGPGQRNYGVGIIVTEWLNKKLIGEL